MRIIGIGATALLLGGCAAVPVRPGLPAPAQVTGAGLDRVMGQSAAALSRLFGAPDAEMQEGTARKLQFAGPFCVLDAYLYPPGSGGGQPVVTYLDTRQPNGGAIDRASCIAALARRDGGR